MKKILILLIILSLILISCVANIDPKYISGVYVGEFEGYLSNIIVEVTLDEYNILDIRVLECHETPIMAEIVLSELPNKVIKNNSSDVDVVAGATYTSNSFLKAVDDALSKGTIQR